MVGSGQVHRATEYRACLEPILNCLSCWKTKKTGAKSGSFSELAQWKRGKRDRGTGALGKSEEMSRTEKEAASGCISMILETAKLSAKFVKLKYP